MRGGPIVLALLACNAPVTTQSNLQKKEKSKRRNLFGTPMCSADGICHENATVPTPRTPYSARTLEQFQAWTNEHNLLVANAATYTKHLTTRNPLESRSRPLILLGDSITESYLGTSFGDKVERAAGTPQVLETFAQTHALLPLVLGISGDQTQHLLWRLQNGELPMGRVRELPGATFVVLIGTNNLGSGMMPAEAAAGVMAIVDWLLLNTAGKIVVLDLLPRGDGKFKLDKLCPPRCAPGGGPFLSFMPAVERVNNMVASSITSLQKRTGASGRLMHVRRCGDELMTRGARAQRQEHGKPGSAYGRFTPTEEEVELELMPDRLHPNAAGHAILLRCLASSGALGLPRGRARKGGRVFRNILTSRGHPG